MDVLTWSAENKTGLEIEITESLMSTLSGDEDMSLKDKLEPVLTMLPCGSQAISPT